MSETSKPRTIAIDVDNTIADYTDGLRTWMRNNIDTDLYPIGPMPEPDFYDLEFASGWIFPNNEFASVHEAAVKDGLYLNLKPIDGVTKAINGLKEHGWTVTIVTGRKEPDALNQTAEWLAHYNIHYDRLTGDKAAAASIYLDDDPDMLIRRAFLQPDSIPVAFDHAYNKQWPGLRLQAWGYDIPSPDDYPEYMLRVEGRSLGEAA